MSWSKTLGFCGGVGFKAAAQKSRPLDTNFKKHTFNFYNSYSSNIIY